MPRRRLRGQTAKPEQTRRAIDRVVWHNPQLHGQDRGSMALLKNAKVSYEFWNLGVRPDPMRHASGLSFVEQQQ